MLHSQPATLVRIRGRVQGVGFRYWTRDEAWELGLSGWVRNEPDGSVRLQLQGEPPDIEEFLGDLRRRLSRNIRRETWIPVRVEATEDLFEIRR